MVGLEDLENEGGGEELKKAIWDAAKTGIEEWTGMEQVSSSVYGIRVYTEGSILSPHVDRIPLVSSAIFNVAQDLQEEWPLEVIDRDGNAVNITMEPGE
jgi:prolyl 4-hydroxylase